MRAKAFIAALLAITTCVVPGAFSAGKKKPSEQVGTYYATQLGLLGKELQGFQKIISSHGPVDALKKQFLSARLAYKKLEPLSEYFNPFASRNLNGPALYRAEDDKPKVVLAPHGFQVVEELLYRWKPGNDSLLEEELEAMKQTVSGMMEDQTVRFQDESIFEALRFSVIRLMALGITGYDSPVAQLSVPEAAATWEAIRMILDCYREGAARYPAFLLTDALLQKGKEMLSPAVSFARFDRLQFITRCADPLFKSITETRDGLGIAQVQGVQALNGAAVSLFAADAFNLDYFAPSAPYQVSKERVALGKLLFSDPILSLSGRTCASCHVAQKAFADGRVVPLAVDGKTLLKRNTPTLWNTVFQTKQFYDSRTGMLESQLDDVVHNSGEMNGSLRVAVQQIRRHPLYASLFAQAYPQQQEPVTAFSIANAVSSYVRSLVAIRSRFDLFMRGNPSSLTAEEQKGFNLFMGKARCGSCHFAPHFNGLVPPFYDETESEVLGVPDRNRKKYLDRDSGKFLFTGAEPDLYSFKTPGLRNSALTAPFMHNGIFKSLEEVVQFYNRGGGRILKNPPSHQTLPSQKLGLSKTEQQQLVSFLQSLTDTTASVTY